MLTNTEFCRMFRGTELTPEQGAEALARLDSVMQIAQKVTGPAPDKIEALSDKSIKETAGLIAEELADRVSNLCVAYADEAVSCDDLTNWRLDNGLKAEDVETLTPAQAVEFASYVLAKYAKDAAQSVKDDVRFCYDTTPINTFAEFTDNVISELNDCEEPVTADDVDTFDPIDAARDTGAPLLFS